MGWCFRLFQPVLYKNNDFEHLVFIHFNNINDKRNATIFPSLVIFLHIIMRQKTDSADFLLNCGMVVVGIYRLPCQPLLSPRPQLLPLFTGRPLPKGSPQLPLLASHGETVRQLYGHKPRVAGDRFGRLCRLLPLRRGSLEDDALQSLTIVGGLVREVTTPAPPPWAPPTIRTRRNAVAVRQAGKIICALSPALINVPSALERF